MKYAALKSFLAAQRQSRLPMSFEQIARAAGLKLPASAYRHPAWWANDPTHHVQAKAWMEAGFVTEQVDLEANSVVFVRAEAARGVREMQDAFDHDVKRKVTQHPMFGAMKGTFSIEPGYDLTKPALDPEELAEWETSLEAASLEAHSAATRRRRKK